MKDNLSFYEKNEGGSPVTVVNVPLELGSDAKGLAATPAYLREQGLAQMFPAIGRELAHTLTISAPQPKLVASAGTMKNSDEIVSVARRSRLAVERALRRGDTVVTIGGDHSMAIGTIAGATAALPSVGLIYIDAHPDANTDITTLSGNIHGMVVAAAMKEGSALLTDIYSRAIPAENILYIGLKDFDEAEIAFIRTHGIQAFTMLDIARGGLAPVCAAIDELASRVQDFWVSMDLDSIDEAYAPGVAMSNAGGLTRREVLSIAHHIGMIGKTAGLDIVEVVPSKDKDHMTAALALELIARFLGHEYNWYTQYMDNYRATNVTREREVVRVRRGRVSLR